MKKIIIAVCDDFTKEIITHCAKAAMPSLQIVDGSNDTDIIYHLKSAEDDGEDTWTSEILQLVYFSHPVIFHFLLVP